MTISQSPADVRENLAGEDWGTRVARLGIYRSERGATIDGDELEHLT